MTQHSKSKGTVLQARDYDILQGLLDSRLLTLKHAALLHFAGKPEAAKKRMQKLRSAGMVVQRSRQPQEPAIYMLGREGYLRLKEAGLIASSDDPGWPRMQKRHQIGDLMLQHELAVLDVKTAFITAMGKDPRLEIAEMSVSPDRHRFRVVEAVLAQGSSVRFRSLFAKPDGFLHICEYKRDGSQADHYFFIEVDRGSESLGRLLQKTRHYNQYYRKGGFAMKRGGTREDYKRFPYRVLIAFKSAQRRSHVAELLLKSDKPIKRQVWLTTIPELLDSPLGPIWTSPINNCTAEKSMQQSLAEAKNVAETIRHQHLEVTVGERIGKMKLFEIEP